MAEGRGKAQADTLRKTQDRDRRRPDRRGGAARDSAGGEPAQGRRRAWSRPASSFPATARSSKASPVGRRVGDHRRVGAGHPRVGRRSLGGDRRHARALRLDHGARSPPNPGDTFLDRMIALVEGAERQKTPNEIALNILLAVLTLVFLLVVVTLQPFAHYAGTSIPIPVLIALLVCLIPTTIGALISAIGIAGMDRLVQHNVLAHVGPRGRGRRRRRHAAARQDRHDHARQPPGDRVPSGARRDRGATLADAAQLASLADETPEGRSIVVLAKEKYGIRGRELASHEATFVPFTAQTRMSGVDLDGREIRKGAADAIARYVQGARRTPCRPSCSAHRRADRPRRRHAAGRRRERPRARRHPSEGHRQGRHARAVRAPARDGHQDGDDHRRQSADGRRDRQGGRRRRLPGARRRPKTS